MGSTPPSTPPSRRAEDTEQLSQTTWEVAFGGMCSGTSQGPLVAWVTILKRVREDTSLELTLGGCQEISRQQGVWCMVF